jgi:hypothetical protein
MITGREVLIFFEKMREGGAAGSKLSDIKLSSSQDFKTSRHQGD